MDFSILSSSGSGYNCKDVLARSWMLCDTFMKVADAMFKDLVRNFDGSESLHCTFPQAMVDFEGSLLAAGSSN